MFTPIGFFAPTGGGGDPIPVDGYSFVYDFSNDNNQITFNGSDIASIVDESGTYTATQANATYQPLWNAGGYIDGASSPTNWWMSIPSLSTIFASRPIASNSYTIFSITNESATRIMPLGIQADGNIRYEIFFNDGPGRRDIIYGGQGFVSGITNDDTKDTVIFATNRNASSQREIYRWGTSESTSASSPGSLQRDARESRIGATSRGTELQYTVQYGFAGKIYCVGMYPKVLSSQERQDIKDWAVNKWGLTLQS